MDDFYAAFYAAVEHSQAHHLFCERAYGLDLSQHGFADRQQLDLLLQVTQLGPTHRALDLGCGNGLIAEYLSDRTGAHITGLDFIPAAIAQARQRTAAKSDRLAFVVGDINYLDLPAGAHDLIKKVLADLKPQFEAEGNLFIYDNRLGDAEGISQAIDDHLHARYLYHVQLPTSKVPRCAT